MIRMSGYVGYDYKHFTKVRN